MINGRSTLIAHIGYPTESFTASPRRCRRRRGCRFVGGTDILVEMIPASLEFFGFGTATPEQLRAVAQVAH